MRTVLNIEYSSVFTNSRIMEGRLEGGLSKNVNCGVCSLYFANRDYDSIIVFKHVILLTGDIL